MSAQIGIADGLGTRTTQQLIYAAGTIIKGLTGNASYPSPPVDIETAAAALPGGPTIDAGATCRLRV